MPADFTAAQNELLMSVFQENTFSLKKHAIWLSYFYVIKTITIYKQVFLYKYINLILKHWINSVNF